MKSRARTVRTAVLVAVAVTLGGTIAADAATAPTRSAVDPIVLSQLVPQDGAEAPLASDPPTVTESAPWAAPTMSNPVAYSLATRPDLFLVTGTHLAIREDPSYYLPDSVWPGNSTAFQPYAVTVTTDAQRLDVNVRGNGQRYRFVVDGKPVTYEGWTLANAVGENVRLTVTFGDRRMREVRFESDAVRMAAWTFSRTDVVLPARSRGPLLLVEGDSITEGTGSGGRFRAWPWLLGHLLGVGNTVASGSGGTGYTVDGSPWVANRKRMCDRLDTDVIPFRPDIVVLAGGRNDMSSPPATLDAEVRRCVTTLRAALPAALIYVTSPLWLGTPPPVVLAGNATMRTAATATGATFLDLLTPALFGGSGRAGAPRGDGPADVILSGDNVHPTPAGHEAIARAVAGLMTADLAK